MSYTDEELALRAQEIVKDPVLLNAFERMQASIDAERKSTGYFGHKTREKLFLKEILLAEFKRELETTIVRGAVEEQPPSYAERLRERVKKSWFN